MIISIVGSGGKTSYVKELKEYYMKLGKTVLITTTTHMQIEYDTLLDPTVEDVFKHIQQYGYAFAGHRYNDEKISRLECLNELKDKVDMILIEADGSRQKPLKYCLGNEPVIDSDTDKIIVITNLKGLNQPVKDVVHRYQQACLQYGWHEDDLVNASMIQQLLRDCYIKRMECEVKVNGASSLYERCVQKLLEDNKDVNLIKKEWFLPATRLVILGAGHVSQYLCKMAKLLDFYTIVVDDREEFANKTLFQDADEIHLQSFDCLDDICPRDENTCYVIVTRGHQADAVCLKQLIDKPHLYLGMIGSKSKIKKTYETLNFSQDVVDGIYAPIGLDIYSQTPAEIAVSILAQIISIKNQKYNSTLSNELYHTKTHGVLCIILEKTGSTPRGKGSMMLVHDHGIIDTIGGGSIEYQVIQDAKTIKDVQIKTYYLNNKDSSSLGMICGGSNKVLFIPI